VVINFVNSYFAAEIQRGAEREVQVYKGGVLG